MDIKWFEDFISLAATKSFSRSAEMRHVTQSAFSRRIQSLEHWAGTPLIERGKNPIELTAAGNTFHGYAKRILKDLIEAKGSIQDCYFSDVELLAISVPPAIECGYLPLFFEKLKSKAGKLPLIFNIRKLNGGNTTKHDENCDFWFEFNTEILSNKFSTGNFEERKLGVYTLKPYSGSNHANFSLRTLEKPIAFISYQKDSLIERAIRRRLEVFGLNSYLKKIYESDDPNTLAIISRHTDSIVFLDEKTADLHGLTAVGGGGDLSIEITICVYRDKIVDLPTASLAYKYAWEVFSIFD